MTGTVNVILGAVLGLLLGFGNWLFLPMAINMQRRKPEWYRLEMFRVWQPRLYQWLGFDGVNDAEHLEALTVRLYRFSPLILGFVGAGVGGFIGAVGK